MTTTSALVVCHGNICRSPMGEAVLAHQAKQRGFDIEVDSAGISCITVPEEPDERSMIACLSRGVPISHRARQVIPEDFRKFTHILATDRENLETLERMKPADATAIIRLWGSYEDGQPIDDPYYGGMRAFEKAYKQCLRYSNAFLDQLQAELERKTLARILKSFASADE